MRPISTTFLLALLFASPSGCMSPFGSGDQPPTEEDLDEEEYERLGCLGGYQYDWERRCRHPTEKFCEIERYVGCQEGVDEKEAYDADGNCWHFNRCIPDLNFWPAGPDDVCDHDRAGVPECNFGEDFRCSRIVGPAACDDDERCRPSYGYAYRELERCIDDENPIFLRCLDADEEEGAFGFTPIDDDCLWTERQIAERCERREDDGAVSVECVTCPDDEEPADCASREDDDVEFGAVRWDGGSPQPIDLADAPGETPSPCIPASLGEPRFRVGTSLEDRPLSTDERWEILIAVRNDVAQADCGFAGQAVRFQAGSFARSAAHVAFWPDDVACNEETYLQIELDARRRLDPIELVVSMTDSCGTGGGTLAFEVEGE